MDETAVSSACARHYKIAKCRTPQETKNSPGSRQVIRHIVRVKFHQCAQRVELPGVHLRRRKSRGLPLQRRLPTGRRQDIAIRLRIDDGDLLLRFIERTNHLEAQVVLSSQRPRSEEHT